MIVVLSEFLLHDKPNRLVLAHPFFVLHVIKLLTAAIHELLQLRPDLARRMHLLSYMRTAFFLALTFYSFSMAPLPSLARENCSSLFRGTNEVELVRKFRFSRLGRVMGPPWDINHRAYNILGLLGQSNASVYLAENPEGVRVAIKMSSRQVPRAYYEIFATEFFLSQGAEVDPIFDIEFDGDLVFVVKRYSEGITRPEFLDRDNPLKSRRTELSRELDLELQKLKAIFGAPVAGNAVSSRFQSWFAKNQAAVETKWPVLKLMREAMAARPALYDPKDTEFNFRYGDVREANMLYNIERAKWILFDP